MKERVQTYLYQHIPISQAMGISVEHASIDKVILSAPIAENINHKKTVFGGSLNSITTLACWVLLYANLREFCNDRVEIVIAKSEVSYLFPVNEDFRAECKIPDKNTWERFLKMLKLKGKARIALSAEIHQNGRKCVHFQGIFAALSV